MLNSSIQPLSICTAGIVCVCEHEEADVKARIWNPFIPGSRGMEFGPKVTLSIICLQNQSLSPGWLPSVPSHHVLGAKWLCRVFSLHKGKAHIGHGTSQWSRYCSKCLHISRSCQHGFVTSENNIHKIFSIFQKSQSFFKKIKQNTSPFLEKDQFD